MTYPKPTMTNVEPAKPFDENAVKAMVEKAMMESMTQGLAGKEPEQAEEPEIVKYYPEDSVTTEKLDVEDSLRMENFLLKQQVESLTRELEESRREKAQRTLGEVKDGLEEFLIKKHEVDPDKFKIRLDPNQYTLSIIPIGLDNVAADNQGN